MSAGRVKEAELGLERLLQSGSPLQGSAMLHGVSLLSETAAAHQGSLKSSTCDSLGGGRNGQGGASSGGAKSADRAEGGQLGRHAELSGKVRSSAAVVEPSFEAVVRQELARVWKDLAVLAVEPSRTPLLCLTGVWFTLSFGYYGLATWITVLFGAIGFSNPYGSSFFYAAANLPGNVAAFALLDRVGRRPLLAGSMASAAVFSLAFAFAVERPEGQASLILAAAMLFNAACTCAWNSINCLSTEAFPTAARATALGLLAAVRCSGGFQKIFFAKSNCLN